MDNDNKKTFTMTLRSRKKKEPIQNNEVKNEKIVKSKNKTKTNNNSKPKIKKNKRRKEEKVYESDKDVSEEEAKIESESEYEDPGNNEESNRDNNFEENTIIKKEQKSSKKRKRIKKNDDSYIKAIKQECENSIENFSSETPLPVIEVRHKLQQEIIPSKKKLLMGYFKTGPGEYADGDQFFGIPVPGIRSVIKYCNSLSFEEIFWLLSSTYHEERMLASLYLTELSKKIAKEENKKNNNKNQYLFIQDNMNAALEKYKCHTIPELIQHFVTKSGCKPGERQGWDIAGILSADKRQKEKYERIGESRPVLLDKGHENEDWSNQPYEYKSHLGFTDPLKIQKQILFEFYVECMPWIDNWDLVDLTCRDIVGSFLAELDDEQIKDILYHWSTYKINDQVAGYSKLQTKSKIKKEISKKEKDTIYPTNEALSLTTLWTKRVAIICTFYFINNSEFRYTIFLLEKLLDFSNEEIHGPENSNSTSNNKRFHDLIEKASGWMLREIGKRDGSCSGKGCKCTLKNEKTEKKKGEPFDLYANKRKTLIHFLNKYAWKMPRTMLRYSIEKLSSSEKSKYLNATKPLE